MDLASASKDSLSSALVLGIHLLASSVTCSFDKIMSTKHIVLSKEQILSCGLECFQPNFGYN